MKTKEPLSPNGRMKNIKGIVIVGVCTIALIGGVCLVTKDKKQIADEKYFTGEIGTINYAANLIDYLKPQENIVISPVNITKAAKVLYEGTDNNSKKELERYLGNNKPINTNHESPSLDSKISKKYEETIKILNTKYAVLTVDTIKLLDQNETIELIKTLTKSELLFAKLFANNKMSLKEIENYSLSKKEESINAYKLKEKYDKVLDEYETYNIKNEVTNYIGVFTNNIKVKDSFIKKVNDEGIEVTSLTKEPLKDKEINKRIKEITNNNISRIIDNDDAYNNEINILGTLYFNYKWDEIYKKDHVLVKEFYNTNNEVKLIEMMYDLKDSYYENEYAKGFKTNFQGNKYSYIAVLPKNPGDFKLGSLDIENLLKEEKSNKVLTALPKVSLKTNTDIKKILKKEEIKEVFSNEANLTRMTEDKVKIGNVVSKVSLNIGEKGTNRSNIKTQVLDTYEKETKENIILNRPYAFLIINNETNEVLLIGKILEP